MAFSGSRNFSITESSFKSVQGDLNHNETNSETQSMSISSTGGTGTHPYSSTKSDSSKSNVETSSMGSYGSNVSGNQTNNIYNYYYVLSREGGYSYTPSGASTPVSLPPGANPQSQYFQQQQQQKTYCGSEDGSVASGINLNGQRPQGQATNEFSRGYSDGYGQSSGYRQYASQTQLFQAVNNSPPGQSSRYPHSQSPRYQQDSSHPQQPQAKASPYSPYTQHNPTNSYQYSPQQSSFTPNSTGRVGHMLDKLMRDRKLNLNWRTSVVDLLTLLGVHSSLDTRQEMAVKLLFVGDISDTRTMDAFLHRAVMEMVTDSQDPMIARQILQGMVY